MKGILTIAGYDPSSGAGITRDLDVFFSLGLHGLSVPTAIVVQGPQGVKAVYPTPMDQFSSMLDLLSGGTGIDGVKIGVVWDEPYCTGIASFLKEREGIPVIVDPVAQAKNDTPLVTEKGLRRLTDTVFPLASVVTPNLDEASILTGKVINDMEGMKEAARAIRRMGPGAVIVKGGHLEGEPIDLLFDGTEFTFSRKRRVARQVHGTGCMFSSALCSFLVHGYPVKEAFLAAGEFMREMLNESYRIDRDGYFYASPGLTNSVRADRYHVLALLGQAGERLTALNMAEFIPEAQLNMGYAIQGARGIEDVAAFPGRIGRFGDRVVFKGDPRFGASSRTARMILAFMKHYPFVRSCANVRLSDASLKKAYESGMTVLPIGRSEYTGPDSLVGTALQGTHKPPDIIHDGGDKVREPVTGLFAENPRELIKKMETIRI